MIDSTFPNPLPSYGWTGREYDVETGFYYLRARYYDPTELRFIQEDSSGYGGWTRSRMFEYRQHPSLSPSSVVIPAKAGIQATGPRRAPG